jgi:hydroxyethylthiazole kinase-like uncharacterized protein yjeF
MIPLVTREVSRALDRDAVERLGLPSIVLMENAGRVATDVLRARFDCSRVVLVGGTGQNGGDAWVVARHLVLRGEKPVCVLVGARDRVSGDAAVQLAVLEAMGIGLEVIDPVAPDLEPRLRALLDGATAIVDGLFGTGLDRALQGGYAAAIDVLNRSSIPILSLDLPSGVDANTGAVLGIAIAAKTTVTFALEKRGLHQEPAIAHAGDVVLADIGVVASPEGEHAMRVESSDVRAWIEPRRSDHHKGKAGHVLVVAGSAGKTGAAYLAGYGALRAGAGLVTIATRAEAHAAVEAKAVEIMTASLGADPAKTALALAHEKRTVAVGPGLGLDPVGTAIARAVALEVEAPVVIDADALTAFVGELELLANAKGPRVLTPHPGEAARLLGLDVEAVQRDRYAAAARLADLSGATVLLKGACSVIAIPGRAPWVAGDPNPALATGGMGDVLTGLCATLLVGLEPRAAAASAVVLQSRAGRLARRGDRGLFARELADRLPDAFAFRE